MESDLPQRGKSSANARLLPRKGLPMQSYRARNREGIDRRDDESNGVSNLRSECSILLTEEVRTSCVK